MPKKSSVLDRIKREISKTSQRGLTMAIIGIYEARTKFSELLDRVAQGGKVCYYPARNSGGCYKTYRSPKKTESRGNRRRNQKIPKKAPVKRA